MMLCDKDNTVSDAESDDLGNSLDDEADSDAEVESADQLSASALASLERQNSRMVTEFAARFDVMSCDVI